MVWLRLRVRLVMGRRTCFSCLLLGRLRSWVVGERRGRMLVLVVGGAVRLLVLLGVLW